MGLFSSMILRMAARSSALNVTLRDAKFSSRYLTDLVYVRRVGDDISYEERKKHTTYSRDRDDQVSMDGGCPGEAELAGGATLRRGEAFEG